MNATRTPRLAIAALAGAIALALLPAFATQAADNKAAAPVKAALTVTTTKPGSADWPHTLSANGSISAWQEAIVGAELSGLRLTEVSVNVGDRVRKGQVIARLQSETTEAELVQNKAAAQEARATLADAEANARRAREVDGTGALSAQQIAQYLTAEQTAKARLAAADARVKADQLRLAQTRVLAPDDGTITARSATLGAVVQAGQELYRLQRRDRLEWRGELPAAELALIKTGMKVSLSLPGGGQTHGKVRTVAPTLDPQTRNGLIYVDLDGQTAAKAGMFARGEIEAARHTVMTVPQAAVVLRDGFSYVFRIDGNNRLIQTKVVTGTRRGDQVAIISGLDAGTAVVSTGTGFLSDGDVVKIVAAPAKAQ